MDGNFEGLVKNTDLTFGSVFFYMETYILICLNVNYKPNSKEANVLKYHKQVKKVGYFLLPNS
ncbi:hypothetical protein J32TS6_28640 [Virgibacillus pantothenticus]|nr:hypothetical protein J32TS6_28640 [Virgibacillus pantothenticus]